MSSQSADNVVAEANCGRRCFQATVVVARLPMGDDPTQGIREILQKQNPLLQPKVLTPQSLLPPIGSRSHSSQNITRALSTPGRRSFEAEEIPPIRHISPLFLGDHFRGESRHSLATTARSASPLPVEDEEEKEEKTGITVVPLKIAELPPFLPAIPGLSTAVDNLSSNRLSNILEACQLYDSEGRGYLSQPTVIKCIGEAHAADSPWRVLLEELAPHGEFIHYEDFLNLIQRQKEEDKMPQDPLPTIPDVLGSQAARKFIEELPSRPTSSQASRERGRVEIVMEIETLLIRHPDLDIESLKIVTHQKVMEQEELLTLLELYGFLEHFQPFLDRLLDSFLTFDNKFHYSAFVGCLQTIGLGIKPPQTKSAESTKIPRFRALPPLKKPDSANK